ncbi:hypothetical protein [Jeongeupia naejangsanensis]|uniref:Uncharacterized protein n=1 Tax=Jeongeupia naejangsanensis TaxID=613195 RepID=A0ABS2BGQ9_9NEIS|nr:hypothetical protein [Jeongeupia naejangsanensis]MBM3114797.1 hypothetical protein [Jeongeupia naejangsanensis]
MKIINTPDNQQASPNGAAFNTSGMGKGAVIPHGVEGWSWGAFLWNWVWAVGNKTWIGLLCLLPYIGFVFIIVLGFKGREWAWQNNKWDSVEHFNAVQRKWSLWGGVVFGGVFCLGALWAISTNAL